jgi:hypothetical protein
MLMPRPPKTSELAMLASYHPFTDYENQGEEMNTKTEVVPADSHASPEDTFDSIGHVSRRAFMTTAALAEQGLRH